jgi:K+-transporting ATPase ATPase A chain
MVGRSPELLGKKIEIPEMKLVVLIVLLHPFITLTATALATYCINHFGNNTLQWLSNPGYHGFSQMLYEFTSASANNGSGFEGLGDNTAFWNISCGIVLLIGRYLPIVIPVAIAGMLAQKKSIPVSAGIITPETGTFAVFLFFVIIIITGLAFLPALSLGPLAEYFSMR